MASENDTIIAKGYDPEHPSVVFGQITIGDSLVTPTNGAQGFLKDILSHTLLPEYLLITDFPDVILDGITHSVEQDAAVDSAIEVARESGVLLDFLGYTIVRNATKTFTNPGLYYWANVIFTKPAISVSNETTFLFSGTSYTIATALVSADVAIGDVTLTVADGSSLVVGGRYLLISTEEYNPDAGDNIANKSEFVTVKSVVSNTVTLESLLQSSYSVAAHATLFLTNTRDMRVRMSNVTFVGAGTGSSQRACRFDNCHIEGIETTIVDYDYMGINAVSCSFGGPIVATGENINKDGFGYLVNCSGCDNPILGDIIGTKVRHCVTFNRSSIAVTVNGTTCHQLGRGGRVSSVTGRRGRGAIFDSHPSHNGLVVGNVTGWIESGVAEQSLTIQGSDITIGNVWTISDKQIISVQHFGKPLDERPSLIAIGTVNGICIADVVSPTFAITVSNYDSTRHSAIISNIAGISVRSLGGGVYAQCRASSTNTAGGDVTVTLGPTYFETTPQPAARSCFYARSSSHGVARLTVTGNVQAINASEQDNDYLAYSYGTDWMTTHPGEIGAYITFPDIGTMVKTGSVVGSYDFRCRDGNIYLGYQVSVSGGASFKQIAGGNTIGDVYRTSAAVAVS